MYRIIYILSLITVACNGVFAQSGSFRTNVSTFETLDLTKDNHYNGNDLRGGFFNGHFRYRNQYDTTWGSWSGFAASAHTDTTDGSFMNEYSSITGGGINGTAQYAVCYGSGSIIPENPLKMTGFYVTNSTYSFRSLQNGTAFSKKFGGTGGNDKDWFRMKVLVHSGRNRDSDWVYLADFRSDKPSEDYILRDWHWVDLSRFSAVDSLTLSFESSDTGAWGMNNPAYVILDDVNGPSPNDMLQTDGGIFFNEPEAFRKGNVWNGDKDTSGGFAIGPVYFENRYNTAWGSWSGWALSRDLDTTVSGFGAQYAAIPSKGRGLRNSVDSAFAVSYGRSVIRLPYKPGGWPLTNFRLAFTNSVYTYKSMKHGDAFSKKFGGVTGNDPDYLRLLIIGYDHKNKAIDTIQKVFAGDDGIFLADYTNGNKYLTNTWVNLITAGFKKNVVRIEFQLESSDNGPFGMNTPAYFCLDALFEMPLENIKKQDRNLNMKLYPNPATGEVFLDIPKAELAEVLDVSGRTIAEFSFPEKNLLDLEGIVPGLYIVKARSGELHYTGKLFIK